ncbi:Conserved hypothetical protein [Clostridium acetobutylicum EA 2018]|uniref:Uncharacterized protein n=4 Tax=Clostridiaceae TaxID=31979 RepID=Q97HM7_CLOAB|nr:Hypothetical protein CA_C1983 [Clostridium acetobutylicum ATCC 824]ADZ21036.1 Conserved hypothetical protein [Clostridium acetobutylicum EA 2018]AEI32113.1 hypothetical protein SMB_G2015 [Clostridium acetobutylicum DSM 1731]AWV79625.1 hypothetical protein DK921_05825 [Clostridium acetobutylicum]PSM07585.1 hypothetical protein C7T89_05825 [Clostridium sp. NJ4]
MDMEKQYKMFCIAPVSFSWPEESCWVILTTGGDAMSDKIILVAIVCVTTLAMTAMVFIATYMKDKLTLKNRTRIKDVLDSEIEIKSENKNSKN